MKTVTRHRAGIDRVGLGVLVLLLLSPIVFKVRLADSLVVHPFVPLLAVAWMWTAWVIRGTLGSIRNGRYVAEWQAWNIPIGLFALVIISLAGSLVLNGIRLNSVQSVGWLLLIKWILYLAPLPFATLLVIRTGVHALRLVSWVVPLAALATIGYSLIRFMQALAGRYFNAYVDERTTYFAMGMLGEVLSSEGLTVRADTMSHGAYGMYLVLVLAFSLSLGIFRGWNGVVPPIYAAVQAVLLCPLSVLVVFMSGSRSSLALLAGALFMILALLVVNPSEALPLRRRFGMAALVLAVPLGLALLPYTIFPQLATLDRMHETLHSPLELQATVEGRRTPDFTQGSTVRAAVRNVQTRVWLWGKSMRYLADHPLSLLTGIGYDRRRFVEEVAGLPYEGYNREFQTAHNLYLDLAIKGGIGPLSPLLLALLWLLWVAVTCVLIPVRSVNSIALLGLGWMLLALWPPLLLVSFGGEELLTDNLLLHWTLFFGLALGLCGAALRSWLPRHIVHLTATAGVGGGPAYVTALVRHQLRQGKQIRIFCSDEKPHVDLWRELGARVTVMPMRHPRVLSILKLSAAILRAPAPMHVHGRGAAFFAVWVKLLIRVPVLYTPHGPHYAYTRGASFLIAWCMEYAFRLVFDTVVYVSQGEQAIAQQLKLPVRGSHVVLSGLIDDPSIGEGRKPERGTIRQELGLSPGQFVIGWIGRLHHQKGLDLLIESMPTVAAAISQVVWVVIGDGESGDLERYRRQAAQAGMTERIRFAGGRPDARHLANAFDLYVSTSRWEGLPLALLEVMAQGVAIAASDVVGNHDVLDGWGLLFKPNDAAAAAQAQVTLARDASMRKALTERGRSVLRERFMLPRMLSDMDGVYGEVLGREVSV